MQTKTKAWLNLIILIATLGINFLGGTGMINDASQGEVSAEFQTLITPAGFAFSIWSVIYGLLVVSMIVMISKNDEPYYQEAINRISPLFWLSSAFNMIWIVTFSYYQIGISILFIVGYLLSLTRIVQILLEIQKSKRWLLPLTFGLNAGWLFIATVVNVSAFLVQINWNGFGLADETWAMIMLSISVVLCLVVLLRLKNAAFPLPIAWAYWGIYQKLNGIGDFGTVEIVALGGMVVLALFAGFIYYRNRFSILPE